MKSRAELTQKLSAFENDFSERILKAYNITGEPDAGAACILLDLGLDADTVIAALVLQGSGDIALGESLAAQFGDDAEQLVHGFLKIQRLPLKNRTDLP